MERQFIPSPSAYSTMLQWCTHHPCDSPTTFRGATCWNSSVSIQFNLFCYGFNLTLHLPHLSFAKTLSLTSPLSFSPKLDACSVSSLSLSRPVNCPASCRGYPGSLKDGETSPLPALRSFYSSLCDSSSRLSLFVSDLHTCKHFSHALLTVTFLKVY